MWNIAHFLFFFFFKIYDNFFFILPLSQATRFRLFKSKEFADDNFELDENGREFTEQVKTLWDKEKLLVTSNFSFSQSVFKTLVLQTRKNQGFFGKGLIYLLTSDSYDIYCHEFHSFIYL